MTRIDIKKIIESHNLDVKELANELFPNIKYPKLALDRVIKGESYLDTNQLSRLALYTGQTIDTLILGRNWIKTHKNNVITFESKNYRAELDLEAMSSKIFHKDSIFHESIVHKKSISLREYIKDVTEIIDNHKKA